MQAKGFEREVLQIFIPRVGVIELNRCFDGTHFIAMAKLKEGSYVNTIEDVTIGELLHAQLLEQMDTLEEGLKRIAELTKRYAN